MLFILVKMFLYAFLLAFLFYKNIDGLKYDKKCSLLKNTKLHMINNYEDLNTIQKFKFFFQKDNYNDVIQNIMNDKIS
jgi:hypothetical protein